MMVATLCFVVSALQLQKSKHHHKHHENDGYLNLAEAFDPHCHEGILNTEMTVCCQADCGECHDGSAQCDGRKTGTGRESTCCPSVITADKVPSCESHMAPCMVPDYVRNPPAQAYGARHAKDDCNKAIPKEQGAHHVATAYLKFDGKTLGAATTSCGTTFGTLAQAAAACSNDDDCMGFEATPEAGKEAKPGCLYKAGLVIEEASDSSKTLYMKREDGLAGHTFKFGHTKWGDCTATCDGGVLAPTYACESSAGVTKKLGLCTQLVLMNPDALPEHEQVCNIAPCPAFEHPIGDCAEHLEGCLTDIPVLNRDGVIGDGYYGTATVCPGVLTQKGWWGATKVWGFNAAYYAGDSEHTGGVTNNGTILYENGYYYGYPVYYDSHLRFECAEGDDVGSVDKYSRYRANGAQDYYNIRGVDDFHQAPVVHHSCACSKKK